MTPLISYKKVEIARAEKIVLHDVDFEMHAGELCYLVGRVGSGKSSLMKTIYAEVPVKAGAEASVLDYDLFNIKRKQIPELRRKIGMVFQDFQLLHDRSAADNLRFVLRATGWKNRDEIEERVEEVLDAVNMCDKGYKMPHELSGGEQQRIVIARALLNKPRLLLADEPTGNLDPITGIAIIDLLHSLSERGQAILMATHNMQYVEQYPARVLRCEDKRLITE